MNAVVIREVGIPSAVLQRQERLLTACVDTLGLDDPLTKEYAASVARHRAICSRLEVTVDNAPAHLPGGEKTNE